MKAGKVCSKVGKFSNESLFSLISYKFDKVFLDKFFLIYALKFLILLKAISNYLAQFLLYISKFLLMSLFPFPAESLSMKKTNWAFDF